MSKVAKVLAVWDREAKLWVATSRDIRGLVVHGATKPQLVENVMLAAPELLKANESTTKYERVEIEYVQVEDAGALRVA